MQARDWTKVGNMKDLCLKNTNSKIMIMSQLAGCLFKILDDHLREKYDTTELFEKDIHWQPRFKFMLMSTVQESVVICWRRLIMWRTKRMWWK